MSQPKEHKSLLGDSFRIFLIRFFSTFASLVVMIWFSHKLPAEVYGVYQNFWVQLTLLSSIAGLGLGLLIFTYPPDVLKQLVHQLKPKHYGVYFLLLIVTGIMFTLLRERQSGTWSESALSFFFFIFYTVSILLESVVIVIRKHKLLIGTGIAYALVFMAAGILSWQQGFSLSGFLTYLLPFTVLRTLVLLRPFYVFMKSPAAHTEQHTFRHREVLSLWFHLGFYDLLSVTILWLDKFAVSLLASAATAAVYFNGSYNIPFIPVALSAVGNATLMQLNYAQRREDKARLMQQAGKVLSCVAYPIFFLLLIYSNEFITVVFSAKYSASVPIFICSILILPVRAYSNTTILQNLHRGRIINIGVLLDFIVALLLIVPLYYLMGLAGVALSFVISTYAQVGFYLYYSAKLLRVPMLSLIPLKNWLLKGLLFAVLVLALHLGLGSLKPLYSISIAAVVTGVAALLVLRYEMKTNR